MEFTARQIAELLGGKIEGDEATKVNSLSKIEEGKPNSISFLANEKYSEHIYNTDASIVIVNNSLVLANPIKSTCTLIRVESAREGFMKLLDAYNQIKHSKTGIEQPSFVAESASIGENVYIGAFTYVGENVKIGNNVKLYPNTFLGDNVTIGDNTLFHSGVKIYSDCIIGNSCVLQAGVIIGGDGFGFVPNSENNYQKIPHTGNVIIEDHVEIGANTTIDRASLGSTIIRKGVKLDNLIQIAHNVEIGENTVLAAQVGAAGSTQIGKNCMIGGQVGFAGHVRVGDNVRIAAQSGVQKDIPSGSTVQGSPCFDVGDYRRSYVLFRQFPKLNTHLNALEKELEYLKTGATK